jgi:hypothetical protein
MADATGAAFSWEHAALSRLSGAMDIAMIEILFVAQLIRNPLQALARRWWCQSLYRASGRQRRCPECTKS